MLPPLPAVFAKGSMLYLNPLAKGSMLHSSPFAKAAML